MEKIRNFISFVIDLVEENDFFYNNPQITSKDYFLNGGCYILYKIVKHYYPDVKCMVKLSLDHCVIYYDGQIVDASLQELDINDYRFANEIDFIYMEEFFGTIEKIIESSKSVIDEIELCNVKGILY